jgi:serine/threonine protein kinase
MFSTNPKSKLEQSNHNPINGFPAFECILAKNIKITSKLGGGTYGHVYGCKYTDNNGKQHEAAIKVPYKPYDHEQDEHRISSPICAFQTAVSSHRKEYQLIRAMPCWENHPNIGITSDYFVKPFGYANHITWENKEAYYFATMPIEVSAFFNYHIQQPTWNIIAAYADIAIPAQEEDTYPKKFTPSIIMERMNLSLQDALHNKKSVLSLSQKIQIAHQVACALYILHVQNIMHGDLKSANILLDANNHAKLSDFGSCARVDYACDTVACTASYAPPEIDYHHENTKPALSIDIYSFGITLLEMCLKGALKTHFDNHLYQLSPSLKETYIASLKKDSSIPRELITLIENCTHAKPTQRLGINDVIAHIRSVQMTEQPQTKHHPHTAALWTNRTETSLAQTSKTRTVKISPN